MLCMASVKSFAQFTGGNAHGYADGFLAQSTCQPLVSDFVFYGGSADGFADGSLTQSNCQPLVASFVFYGGSADGYSDALLTQSNCQPLVASFVFLGGNADGYSDALLTQSNCQPLVANFVFFGGNADGYSDGLLTQSNCPPLVSNFVFFGGNADGYGDGLLTQSNCPPLVSNFVFFGGNADGYGDGLLSQSNCPPLISNFVFFGGNADGFSFFVLKQSNCPNITPLPIELLSFTAEKNNSLVEVKWSTASELNNDYFMVERSQDATNFELVAKVPAAGNSNTLKRYATQDEKPYQGLSYYRLKQTDFDGTFNYSKIVAIDFLNEEFGLRIYPNPTSDLITIDFLEQVLPPATRVFLSNVYGQQLELNQIISKNQIKVDLSQLPSGIYFVGISLGEKIIERKIVLQK
jgi:hypothetical protein